MDMSGEKEPEKDELEKEKLEKEKLEKEKLEKDELEKGENPEGLVEDFSDFGESDDEILNQEDEKGESRPDSSNSNKSEKQSQLLDGKDVLKNFETLDKSESSKKPEIMKVWITYV